MNEKRSATQNPQGTHSTHAKCVIDQSKHFSWDLAVLCSEIPITTHSLCMIQPVTAYYTHIPLSAYICALYTTLSLCIQVHFFAIKVSFKILTFQVIMKSSRWVFRRQWPQFGKTFDQNLWDSGIWVQASLTQWLTLMGYISVEPLQKQSHLILNRFSYPYHSLYNELSTSRLLRDVLSLQRINLLYEVYYCINTLILNVFIQFLVTRALHLSLSPE